ncbi:ion transporter [Candidatus Bodocaedibacter vickermanii]|uniref:Ion transporter n=1 Tax=Candidatus Bodocaedibacter vickermanii TaxID=2741701 RepID=A0A7L9RS50_9PROT|nr:ion transporter [Candidatus Paracaedibacteraceae bacterium 'Lake Konstanz']
MFKKHFIHQESALHKKIHYSLMFGGLHHFFMGLILLYAVINGFSGTVFQTESFVFYKSNISSIFYFIMLTELGLKFLLNTKEFVKKPWHILEVGILVASWFLPGFLVLMTFRFIAYLYTFLDHPVINRVIHTFVHSIPTLMMSSLVLSGCLVCYSLLTTTLFGNEFPELFGHIGKSLFTFIQLMTFDDWMAYILRPVMELYPWSWLIFISFIVLIVFGVMNVFVGTIVNAMNFVDDAADDQPSITDLQKQIAELKELIQKQHTK